MRFVFLLLVFIASVAYAAPHPADLVNVFFVNKGDVSITKGQLPKGDQDNLFRVRLETSTARPRVLEILRLIGPDSPEMFPPGAIENTIRWTESNFYYPERMAGRNVRNNVHEMQAFFRIETKHRTYHAWIAYGSHQEYGMSTYASVMEVDVDGPRKKLKELARVTDTKDTGQKEWESLHKKFMDNMTKVKIKGEEALSIKDLTFDSLDPKLDAWKDTPLVPIEISFVTAQGEVLKATEAKKWETQRVLQLMGHALVIPNPPPKNLYHWADNTVFPTVSETSAPTFLRLERPDFGVAYAWIAPVDPANGKRLYASIMKEEGSVIQEIARVMDLEDGVKKWKDINDKFLAQVGFFHNKKASFIQALSGAWSPPTLPEEDSAEGLAHLHATAGAAAVLLQMKHEKPAGPGV